MNFEESYLQRLSTSGFVLLPAWKENSIFYPNELQIKCTKLPRPTDIYTGAGSDNQNRTPARETTPAFVPAAIFNLNTGAHGVFTKLADFPVWVNSADEASEPTGKRRSLTFTEPGMSRKVTDSSGLSTTSDWLLRSPPLA